MKSTGIIRRIDDLGRIVIPKEIRKNLRIKEGDNLEIFVNNDDIIFKKYSMMNKIADLAQELTDAIYTFMKHTILIADNNIIISGSGKLKKSLVGKEISDEIVKSIQRRERILENHFKQLKITSEFEITCSYVLNTIFVNGEAAGIIIILDEDEKLNESEMQISSIVSSFMTKYLEQ